MGPELAGAAELGSGHELTPSGLLLQELLSRATQQGAAALSAGRASDAVKLFTEAAELARATAGVTPAVVSDVLAQRSAAQLAAGDPERALDDSLAAVQLSATSEVRARWSVSSAPQQPAWTPTDSALVAGAVIRSLRVQRTASALTSPSILYGVVEAPVGRVRAPTHDASAPHVNVAGATLTLMRSQMRDVGSLA